jgi:hypothetical protein
MHDSGLPWKGTKGLVLSWRRFYRRFLLQQHRRVDHFNYDQPRGNQLRQLLSSFMSPDNILFIEDSSEGTWVLKANSIAAEDLMA